MKARATLLFCLLACCASSNGEASGAAGGEGNPAVVKIFSSLPRTGNARQQTDTIVNGIRMALDEVNSRVGDFKLEYVDGDDATASAGEWTAEQESANARQAAADPDVMVYIGPYNSGAAKSSMPILNRAGLLMISPANTAIGLTKPNPANAAEPGIYRPTGKINYTRVVPADDLQGPLGAEWAKKLGFRRVFVLDDHEVYGRGIAQLFENRAAEIGLTIVGHDSIGVHDLEFRSLMTSIKAKDPDLVYFGGTTQSKAGQVAKDLVAVACTAKLMVPDGCMEQAFIESAGAENLNDRCYVTFGGLPPEAFEANDPKLLEKHKSEKEFVDRYQARFGRLPEAYAIYGYEAAKVAIEAIRRAGKKDRTAIVAACLGIKDFHGALGTWSFDANGDTTLRQLSGNIVHDGRFKFLEMLGDWSVSQLGGAAGGTTISLPHQSGAFWQQLLNGLTFGALIALIALGYTMVYGIIGLINFAHGDLFMLGSFLAWTLIGWLSLDQAGPLGTVAGIALLLVVVPLFCAGLNWSVDRLVYKPLRNAPKLAPLVSAIGVSFLFMNIGEFWGGPADRNVPNLVPEGWKDVMLLVVVVPIMLGLTLLVKYTQLGRAMRATAQNPVAAQLMGINVDRVIGATFLIGGALAGVASVIYGQYVNTIGFQMGYTNGLYAFTAAVLGGIGNIPGAVLGGIVLGLIRALGSAYVSEHWVNAIIFGILILILVFRPAGLLGERVREKV